VLTFGVFSILILFSKSPEGGDAWLPPYTGSHRDLKYTIMEIGMSQMGSRNSKYTVC
jgi:hypothetical protein